MPLAGRTPSVSIYNGKWIVKLLVFLFKTCFSLRVSCQNKVLLIIVDVGDGSCTFEKLSEIGYSCTGLWTDLVLENCKMFLKKSLKVLEFNFHNPVRTLLQASVM